MAPFLKNIFSRKPKEDNDDDDGKPFSFCLRLPTSSMSSSAPLHLTSLHRPPIEYICPICFSLMSDPVSLPSSYQNSYHLQCLQAYHQLNPLPDFNPIPNQILRTQIHQWCEQHGRLPPPSISRSRAREAARTMHMTSSDNNQEPPSPPSSTTTRTNIENILMKLRDSRTSSRQDALTALAEYTNLNNRAHLCRSIILDPVISMFFTYSPDTTAAATTFLLNLSTDLSTRHKIAHHSDAAFVSCLLYTMANRHISMITPNARDEAAITLYNLTLEVRNKALMGSTRGLLPGLVEYWIGGSTASRHGRQSAGWALKNLVTSCPENVRRLMEEDRVVERILGLARNKEEGNSTVRRPAFMVLAEMGRVETGRKKLVKGRVMEEMVRMLREREAEKWCLEVMWGICDGGGMRRWEFKVVAKEAGADEALAEMREEWGREGLEMAERMLKVIEKKYKVKGQPKPLDLMDTVAEDSHEEEDEDDDDDDGGRRRQGGEGSSS